MSEFDLIRRLQEIIVPPGAGLPDCVLGIGDDAAVLDLTPGKQLVVTVDTMVEGVHFLPQADPERLGHKTLAVNLSDLASMGAEPAWFFLSLTLPSPDQAWLDAFACGMAALAHKSRITLAGGDTTSGPLSISVTALGTVDAGKALTRGGARPGDLIVVSGTPGLAAYALEQLKTGQKPPQIDFLALERPTPRLALGRALRGLATACIDISDGLYADLGHLLQASGVGAKIRLSQLPEAPSLDCLDDKHRFDLQLSGGDDYELCFTVSKLDEYKLSELALESVLPLTVIGEIVSGSVIRCIQADGQDFSPLSGGFDHFGQSSGPVS